MHLSVLSLKHEVVVRERNLFENVLIVIRFHAIGFDTSCRIVYYLSVICKCSVTVGLSADFYGSKRR